MAKPCIWYDRNAFVFSCTSCGSKNDVVSICVSSNYSAYACADLMLCKDCRKKLHDLIEEQDGESDG